MTAKKKPKTTAVARRKRPGPGQIGKKRQAKDPGLPASCPSCGRPVGVGSKDCPACGTNIDPGAVRRA